MAISWPCPLSVDAYARTWPAVAVPRPDCPACRRPLSFQGSYPRTVRVGARLWPLRVPRAACGHCNITHALLPDFVVYRRRDSAEVIGAAIAQHTAATDTARQPADATPWQAVPASTVRSWRQRFASRQELLGAGLAAVTVALSGGLPQLPADPALAALAAIGAVWVAARRRVGPRIPPPWRLANLIIGGALLATHTHLRWAVIGVAPIPAAEP